MLLQYYNYALQCQNYATIIRIYARIGDAIEYMLFGDDNSMNQ